VSRAAQLPDISHCKRTPPIELAHPAAPGPPEALVHHHDRMKAAAPLPAAEPSRLWVRLAWAWGAFWLLMLSAGVIEYLRVGGRQLWEPLLDYATAALVTTAIALLQLRHAPRLDGLLDQPLRWFLRLWAWLPLLALAYVAALYGLRHAARALIGEPYRHGPWGEVLLYESIKFAIFYTLFSGVHFGLRSYRAWAAERVRTEHQARLAEQAQLAQLTQQLQPHFLFNALNTVSALIHTDPDLADTLLTRLATLLRAATDAGQRPEQPLADELVLLEAYADIMTRRFADRASVHWQVDADARACAVPTLGLQPLLENCFRHVVEQRRAPTRIVVRARRSAGVLCIEVEDDGDAQPAPPVFGVGLGNLQRRLRALHGARAGVTLHARPGGGMTVRVELPCA
jgi:two-component system, LytTR family, sensor kinase